MHQYKRTDRLGDQIRAEVADIIARKIKDPRIGFVTVTSVDVSEDLRHAKVSVSVYGDEKTQAETMKGLNSAAGFVKGEIGRRIKIKFTPDIIFRLDSSLEKAAHVLEILEHIKKDEDN
ncbi:MAG: 30S ribosome-binding factor RbfA [Nitrospirae bacterium]|nr:30S ribosome-binding factor RbfA [Nitrospirota bacterium]